ncbi:MAG: hypothetical protein HOC71_14305 [Candidatus Latescibacteria bacterium]|jgi:N-acylglucosamine 2-epimerase|nr:hypothetical protein [Candidatus Latescibacterota bacterium]
MVCCLLAIEHTHAPWAVDWFNRAFVVGYIHPERWVRNCLLHHPRRLFFVIDILDHIIERNGRISNFLEVKAEKLFIAFQISEGIPFGC